MVVHTTVGDPLTYLCTASGGPSVTSSGADTQSGETTADSMNITVAPDRPRRAVHPLPPYRWAPTSRS